ncbi:MAG: flagellar basal-body MS-ring/collar protein FliF [Pseudomonadota bacterium]
MSDWENLVDGIANLWSGLDLRRKIIVIAATVAVFASVLGLSRMASTPSMSLLYAGLEPAAAGEVITALQAATVPYDVKGNAIYVPAAQRDGLRLSLAAEGLPASGGAGYELLDNLSGFATTSQMFDAAYWRAKEGELARTILASPQFNSARVHIGRMPGGGLRRPQGLTASVTVGSSSGTLSARTATALKFLVGSAVAGLEPADVSVIDSASGQVFAGDPMDDPAASGQDRAAQLRANVTRILEARVGRGKAVVEVAIESVTESEQITERVFDPESRVAISTDIGEQSSQARENASGVSVASNLPTGDAASGQENSNNTTRTNERINYEVSETQRELVRAPGAIKRLSVAVLVDAVTGTDDTGQTITQARPPEELEALRGLVASAVGFDEARGDVITITSLEFSPLPAEGTGASAALLSRLNIDVMTIAQSILLAAVALALGLFVVRPIFAAATPGPAAALASPEPSGVPALTGEIAEPGEGPQVSAPLSDTAAAVSETLPALPNLASLQEDPVERLRSLIQDRQDDTVGILRSWMEADETAR